MKYALVCLICTVFIIGGCAGQKELIEEQRTALEEMADENSRLQTEIGVLRDSLQFVDDIETGQYYRDRRVLEQRIDRLEYEIAICRDSSEVPMTEVAVLTADELFEPASATLTDAGAERLARLTDDLKQADQRVIRVEGHSDSLPLGQSLQDRYPSNWELSAARASAVVRHFVDRHGFEPQEFEVAAFGDSQPVASNQTPDGRRQNRRVRIALY